MLSIRVCVASLNAEARGRDVAFDARAARLVDPARLTVFGGEHGLGGVAGYDLAETTDESPARVAAVQLLTWAYLRTQLYAGDPAWQEARTALEDSAEPLGRIESK